MPVRNAVKANDPKAQITLEEIKPKPWELTALDAITRRKNKRKQRNVKFN